MRKGTCAAVKRNAVSVPDTKHTCKCNLPDYRKGLDFGIVLSSLSVLCKFHVSSFLTTKKDNKAARPSDSGQVTFIVFFVIFLFFFNVCILAEKE